MSLKIRYDNLSSPHRAWTHKYNVGERLVRLHVNPYVVYTFWWDLSLFYDWVSALH